MLKLLIAVDGSQNALRAVDHLVKNRAWYTASLEVFLLNVQVPMTGVNIKLFVKAEDLNAYYHDEGVAALKDARALLDAAGIHYSHHIGVGDAAKVIVQYVEAKQCDKIVLGSRGAGVISDLVLGSVATKVISLAKAPVLLVK